MNLAAYSNALQTISQSYALNPSTHNFEIILPIYGLVKDEITHKLTSIKTDEITYYANIRQTQAPYLESNETLDRSRVYIEGNLIVQSYIDLYTQDKLACIWYENNDKLIGYFYPIKHINNSVAQAGRVDFALGQRIKGYVELAS